jgi:hypothetical protein
LSRPERREEQSGVLVIRVWAQGDTFVRARVTRTLDVSERDEETSVVANVDGVFGAVTSWLEDFLSSARSGSRARMQSNDSNNATL